MREIQVQMPTVQREGDCAGRLVLTDECDAALAKLLMSGRPVVLHGGVITKDGGEGATVLSVTLVPKHDEPRIAPHTEVEVDGSRVAYNPSTSDRLAYVAMKLGTARVLMSQNAMDDTCQVIDDACNYIREAACDKGVK